VLTRNHRQEALCRAYVQAIAARCGMSCSVPSPDYGIDLTLNDIEEMGGGLAESGYKLDVQAKSATRAAVAEDAIRYDLPAQAYEVLRQPAVGCPRILVVLVLPRDEARWSGQTEEALILRHCAYWLSLKGHGPTANRRSVRVSIPRANVFSVEALHGLMARIKGGAQP
jgi:hypothetical protein